MTDYDEAVPGIRSRDHWMAAPLDHQHPDGAAIDVYAREVTGAEHDNPESLPWLLFLQGGPGGKAPRPTTRGGWLDAALKRYRVLLLDQRGTGRSTPLTPEYVAELGADNAVEYLAQLRADSIVRDAELFREQVAGVDQWVTLGQSYGGFCTFSYLSMAPQSLSRCLVTGGIPPIGLSPEEVYRRTWPRVIAKNAGYFRRHPGDRDILRRVLERVDDGAVLPSGERLTRDRVLALGISFGGSTGYADTHYLMEEAFAGRELSPYFLNEVAARTSDLTSPLYALLQEAIYCEGEVSSNWAASRTRAEIRALAADSTAPLFTGETKERWSFTDVQGMQPYLEVADGLHSRGSWTELYDQTRLRDNEVPVAAAAYYDDMYVDFDASMDVARRTGNVRVWVTNQFEHDGLRADAAVFERLDEMTRGMA